MQLAIEERTLNAWPAQRNLLYDGWMLRFTGGYTRRANSISALYPGNENVADKITWCEQQYRERNLSTIFKVCPFSSPDTLDHSLEDRGYQRLAETDVMHAPITSLPSSKSADSDIAILSREQWLAAFAQITRQEDTARLLHLAILSAMVPVVCPVVMMGEGIPKAIALGVLERGMVGIYDLVTDTRCRRQGCATQILSTILGWAISNGATSAYLQVMSDNQTALRLYEKLGFAYCYKYWYRMKG